VSRIFLGRGAARRLALSLLVVSLVSVAARAENVKTFLEAAEQGSVDRRISIEQRNRAAAEYRQAWTSLLPSLSASAGWTHNQYPAEFPNPMDPTTTLVIIPQNQFDGALRFDVPLIDTQRWFRSGAAGALEDAAALREVLTRDAVRRQTITSYYVYAAMLAVGDSARKSAAVADEQLKLMEIRAKVGTVTELDLLRAKAEVQRTRQVVADTVSSIANARRLVRTITSLEPPEQVPLPVDDVTPALPLAEYESRIDQTPAVMAANKEALAAERIATGSRLALVPSVSGQFTQRFTNATGFQNRPAIYNAGINLTWRLDVPTFMNMQAQAANEQIGLLAVDRARLVTRDQIHTDWQRLQAALIKIDAARSQVEAARRAAQVAKDRYAAGVATQVDVIGAERDVFGAEVNQIQARTELATARMSLLISAALPLE
jgi:outer membrane protein TolC